MENGVVSFIIKDWCREIDEYVKRLDATKTISAQLGNVHQENGFFVILIWTVLHVHEDHLTLMKIIWTS